MKKIFKFLAAALIIVAATSCTKENPSNSQVSDQEIIHKVFRAFINVDSKTTLIDGEYVHWTEGDKIMVLPSGSANATEFDLISHDETFADFEGETIDANSYRAVYPASALLCDGHINWWQTDGTNYLLGSKESKTGLAHQYAVENNFSVVKEFNAPSNFALSTSSKDGHLYFQNINAYLKLSLDMDDAAVIEVSAAKAMNSYNSLSEEAKLGGGIYLTFGSNKVTKTLISGSEDITFEKENGHNLLPNVNYYIAIPAVKIEGLKLVVKDANGKVLQSFTKASTFTAESNKIYDLGKIEPAPIPEPKVGDYFYSDGTFSTELDKSKTPVGVIFYTGDPTEDDSTLKRDYPDCTHGLVVGLEEKRSMTIGTKNVSWEVSGFMTTIGSKYQGGVKRVEPAASLKTGYNNTKAFESVDSNAPALIYCREMLAVLNVSPWYMLTIAECDAIREHLSTVNLSIKQAGGSELKLAYGTLSAEDYKYIATYNIENGSLGETTKISTATVRPIFAF